MAYKQNKHPLKNLILKIRSDKDLARLIIISALLLACCFLVGLYHVQRVYNAFRDTSYDYMFDRAQVTSRGFANDFDRKGSLVSSEAAVLSDFNTIDKERVCNCIKALESSGEFKYARYISNRSVMYKVDGSTTRVDINLLGELISSTNLYSVFKNESSADTNDEVCFGAPVLSNGIVQGYIIGIVNASDLFLTFDDSSASSVAERYLVDEKGNIIVYTKAGGLYDGTGKNIYDILTRDCLDDFDAQITKEEIENQIVADEMMKREVSVNGYKGYALFKMLTTESGWGIFYIVYDDTVQSIIRPVLVEALLTVVAIMIIMASMSILIMTYLSQEQKKMHELAYVDALTNAPNENAFVETAETILHDNPSLPYVVMCFDILNFRYINEGYGHQKADMLLRAFASALAESYSYNETFARIGADRFVSLCIDDGRIVERRKFILEKVKETTDEIAMKYPIRIKVGIYYVKNRKESVADMIDKANLARKSVNVEERSLQAEYREKLMENTRHQEQIESRMEAALEKGEFVPYLQPKWDMERDCICGAEALIRWKDKDGKIIPPGDFIPLFEKNGFIERVDFYMLEEVCKYLRRMLDEGREVYPISVNQSRYLMYDPNYLTRIQEIFLKYKVPKGLVELELTETVFFHEKNHMVNIMKALKDLNMNLSIDDFGSGYSSLNLLRDIPFDVLKIDREFLDESVQSESGKWILRKIVEMAAGLNLRVICEGVETREQVEMLLEIGCRYAQGYLYSRPIPMEEYIDKYNIIIPKEERYYFTW